MVGAPGYALRTDHGNPESTEYLINPFAQLDAHNSFDIVANDVVIRFRITAVAK